MPVEEPSTASIAEVLLRSELRNRLPSDAVSKNLKYSLEPFPALPRRTKCNTLLMRRGKMKTATFASLAIVATGLIVNVASPAEASYEIGHTTGVAVDEAAAPMTGLKLSADILLQESVEPNTAEFTRTAANYTRKRRLRIKSPTRVKRHRKPRKPSSMTTGNNTQTHAEAPLDCSIESHPDCPRPSGGGLTIPIWIFSTD